MIGKGMYLRSIGKGNDLFIEAWEKVATDLSVLETTDGSIPGIRKEDEATLRKSPLYRVYHVGMVELKKRLEAMDKNDHDARKALTARSIQAIKASLDGAQTRETQRLNKQLVLLTIAISGGPFLGLLGTVVGVMITFAAVAVAGDVNVNAIAPGIAAALAATVAGLAVAIPSLFGYNYLLTRVKESSTDMHIFIDEFISKLAEFYSETVINP
jgi:biopolymer transport protein ExbB